MLTGVGALGTIPWPFRRLWRSGDLWARLLALAYLTFGLLLLLHILSTLGWLPYSDWNGYVGMASNLCHILLLHFALLLHLRRIEADHAQALEAAALARQETAVAKAAEEEQARLLAMISHEIRTPISVIAASTQSLEALDAAPPPRARRALRPHSPGRQPPGRRARAGHHPGPRGGGPAAARPVTDRARGPHRRRPGPAVTSPAPWNWTCPRTCRPCAVTPACCASPCSTWWTTPASTPPPAPRGLCGSPMSVFVSFSVNLR